MPELPEVETLRLQLSRLIIGKIIKSVDILKAKSFIGDKRYVIGEKIVGVRRFAKILVFDLSNGLSLAVHLKMSGQLIYQDIFPLRYSGSHGKVDKLQQILPNKHTRVIFTFSVGDNLYFNDQRIFGWIKVVINDIVTVIPGLIRDPMRFRLGGRNDKLSDLVKDLGSEPLRDLTLEKFQNILKSSRKPIKLLLMDQKKIAGVGNIYANEALFLAGINPKTKARIIPFEKKEKLFYALLKVLAEGIKYRGASDQSYLDAYGKEGQYQKHFRVYQQDKKPCPNHCGEKIVRSKLGGRGTFFCPACQR